MKNFILKFLGWSADERALPVLMTFLELPDTAEVAAQGLIDFGSGAMPAILETLRNAEEDEIVALLCASSTSSACRRRSRTSSRSSITTIR